MRKRGARAWSRTGAAVQAGAACLVMLGGLSLGGVLQLFAGDDEPRPQGPVETVEVRDEAEGPAAADPTAFATIIRAEDFAGRVTSVPELLREAVGVQVRSLGGEFATVSVRGSSAEQVVVYLDGVPLNRALGGGVNLADLPLGQVESIVVYRGFTPAGLPAASIGGAVMITTRRARGASLAAGSLSFGSFGTAETAASFSASRGGADHAYGLDAGASRGDFRFLDDNATPHDGADDVEALRVNNDFRRLHLSGRSSFKAGDRVRVGLSSDLFRKEQGVPGKDAVQSEDARFDTSRLLVRSDLEAPGFLGGRLLLRGAVDYTLSTEEFTDPGGAGFARTRNRIESLGQEASLTLAASRRQAISALVARRSETARLRDFALPSPERGVAGRRIVTATLEDQFAPAGDRLLLNPSLRHEAYESTFQPGGGTGVVPGSPQGAHTTGKIGFLARASESLAVKGNLGRFVRLPDFIELFGNSGAVLGNPALAPERGRSFDLGFVTTLSRPGPALRQAAFEAILFETLADDLIVFVPNPQNRVVAKNLGRARIRGLEMNLAIGVGPRFTGSLNATLQRPVNESGDFASGSLIPLRPSREASATAGLAIGRGRLTYSFTYVGRNYVDEPNTESQALPARYLHDLAWRLVLPRDMEAVLEAKNLGDQLAYDVAGFPLPGRSLHGRLSWRF